MGQIVLNIQERGIKMVKNILTINNVFQLTANMLNEIGVIRKEKLRAYAIPRGGVPVGIAASVLSSRLVLVENPAEADIFIDDIIDSGATRDRYAKEFPGIPFYALIDKTAAVRPTDQHYGWVVFPWESENGGIEDNITRLLQFVGEDPKREGLQETPARVVKAWQHWTSGYGKDPKDILKCFEDGSANCDEMILVKDIPFYTHCEHHLAPFFGTATVAYIPQGKIVGLSKISRIVDMYARRLQVQERLTNEIADAIFNGLDALGVGVLVTARHLCMESRGICQQGHTTVTSALRGAIKESSKARAEFLMLAK